MLDVAIIGGGAAGLSAALVLGRMRRSVLIVDGGQPRNAVSPAAHGFLTRDGISPAELLQIGREQLAPYDTVVWQQGLVMDAQQSGETFELRLSDGTKQEARSLVLATGVQDLLPEIEGIEAFWGTSILHCPYCHGWEVRDKPIAVLADGDAAMHFITLLTGLSSDLAICTNGATALSTEDKALLQAWGVPIYEETIVGLSGNDGGLESIHFGNGDELKRSAAFVRSIFRQHSMLAQTLGCELNEHGFVQVDNRWRTSVAGVYAVGDMTGQPHQVIRAAAAGAQAGMLLNHALATQQFYEREPQTPAS